MGSWPRQTVRMRGAEEVAVGAGVGVNWEIDVAAAVGPDVDFVGVPAGNNWQAESSMEQTTKPNRKRSA